MQTNKVIKEFYKTGQLEYEIPFFYWEEAGKVKRLQHGTQRCYWASGQLKEEIPYSEGVIDGEWNAWYPDGRPRWLIVYDKGTRISKKDFK